MLADILPAKHCNLRPQEEGGPNHWEIWLRDPDGHTVVLASDYGTADGSWSRNRVKCSMYWLTNPVMRNAEWKLTMPWLPQSNDVAFAVFDLCVNSHPLNRIWA
jgi:hypothetical protein